VLLLLRFIPGDALLMLAFESCMFATVPVRLDTCPPSIVHVVS
jgi:hypothetical protein